MATVSVPVDTARTQPNTPRRASIAAISFPPTLNAAKSVVVTAQPRYAWRSRGRWSTIHRLSLPTNRPALDTRTSIEIMAIFQHLNVRQGITMIVVTHESDIAAYANRNMCFRDGKIVRDDKIAKPKQADLELLHLAHT